MAAVMDLDLNCSPPSPEPAAQDDLRRSMLRQQHASRDQVQDLHRLYWTQKNLTDVPPFWKQSHGGLYAHHPHSHMVDLDDTKNRGIISHCYELGNQTRRYHDSRENLDVKASIKRKPDNGSVQGRSSYRCVIDLERPATLDDDDDDDVEIISTPGFIDYATQNGGSSDKSQCTRLESLPAVFSQLRQNQNAPHVSSGSTGSSDTPDSHSPVKAKTIESGRVFIDLNIAQDDFNVCPDPSEVLCSVLGSSTTGHSRDFGNNSSKTSFKGSDSSIGSSKGSSITVVTNISAPDSSREEMAAGLFRGSQSHQPFCVEDSKYNVLLRGNIQNQNKISGLDSWGCMPIPGKVFSVSSNGGNNNSSSLPKLGDSKVANLMGQPVAVVHKETQEEAITVTSDDEVEGIDLNIAVEGIDLPSMVSNNSRGTSVNNGRSEENKACLYLTQNECRPSMVSNNSRGTSVNNGGSEENKACLYLTQNECRQNIFAVECSTIRMPEGEDGKNVQSLDSGIAISSRSELIPETPQGRDYACPRLRSSNNGASVPPDTVSNPQAELVEDDGSATTAAETLLSIFANSSAWMTYSHGSNSQTDARDEPQPSLNSFEETILNLEEIKDDGESIPVRPPDKEGPSCGIKLKRGRGLRDFQREILPGLISLARHEICDDLHAIGYELRRTRSRRTSGDQFPPATRTRLPRRCSAAWNQ